MPAAKVSGHLPTPEPTPEPTPKPLNPPVVIKQPANVTVSAGGTAYFTAKANNATEITWYIAGPEGKTGYPASEIGNYIAGVYCTGCNEETLTVYNLSLEADGWKTVCRRCTNEYGKSYSTAAVIHVQ